MDLIIEAKKILSLSLPNTKAKQLITEAAFLGFFIAFFILIFQPFGTYEFQIPYKTQRLIGYGLVVFVTYLPFKKILITILKENPFTFQKELITNFTTFLLVAFCCFLYFKTIVYTGAKWNNLYDFMIFCFAIGFIPLAIVSYNRYAQGIKLLEKESLSKIKPHREEIIIQLKGTNQSEQYQFNQADILYLQSSGNYVEVFFIKNEAVQSVLIRNTFSGIKEQLPQNIFATVHRSYAVNKVHFSKLKKEQGKGLLIAEKWSIEVPVSRTNLSIAEKIVKDFR